MKNNPYINIVQKDDNIIFETQEIYKNFGNWSFYFKNTKEIFLEIGTGLGNFFSIESQQNLDKNFIGMEIKYKRLYKTALKTRNLGNNNFVLFKDFGQNIDKIFSKNEISRTYIFFPDPWDNKDRQKKHKLLQKDFLIKLYQITKDGGEFFFKTDHKKYFDEVLVIIEELGLWKKKVITYDYEKESLVFTKEKLTEFESMFRGEKLKINYAEFTK